MLYEVITSRICDNDEELSGCEKFLRKTQKVQLLGMQSVMQPIGYKTKNVALYRTVFTFFLICVATVTLLLASRTGVYRFGDISFVEMNFLFISNDSSVDFCPFAWQTNVLVTQKS